jgi:ubiquinone/menaquinone biosynthesis C-methylase UbiE
MTGWDHPDTVRYYEAFNRRHTRYRTANRALVRHAQLRPGLRVLDFAAGTGGTPAAALDVLGADGRVDCVEPAQAMRAAGAQ